MDTSNKIIACCILKNETKESILEWVDYHKNLGVEHFILYDHGDIKSVKNIIVNSIYKNIVTVIDWFLTHKAQNEAYNHCITLNKKALWIAFIDIDEFISIENNENIGSFLDKYKNYSAVCLNWIIYNANGHVFKPTGDLLSNYTRPLDHRDNKKIKSIAQPKKVLQFIKNPHLPNFIDNNHAVDIMGNIVSDPNKNFIYKTTYIKHFITKSFEEWLDKLDRGRANYKPDFRQKLDLFWEYNPDMISKKNTIYNTYKERIENYKNGNYRFL